MVYSSSDEYVSIVFVGTSTPPLWFYETWTPIARGLDSLVDELGQKVGVRTTQSGKGAQLKFGRLTWREQSDRKWTHDSPDTNAKSEDWVFMAGEVWCPHWAECQRSRVNPSLFLSMANPFFYHGGPKPGQFNQLLHLAMPTALFRKHAESVSPAIATVKSQLRTTDCVMRLAPWNKNYDSLQDTLNNHMKYADYTNDMRFDITRTDVKWDSYDPGAIG